VQIPQVDSLHLLTTDCARKPDAMPARQSAMRAARSAPFQTASARYQEGATNQAVRAKLRRPCD